MTLMIVLALSLVVGMRVARWSSALLPLLLGACVALILVTSGHDISDTPIPFVVVTATAAIAAGVLLRGRMRRT